MANSDPPTTVAVTQPTAARRFRCFTVDVVEGPAAGAHWAQPQERCTIGSHASNDLILDDPTVSRFHCEIAVAEGRFRVRDLGSRNGTLAGDVTILDALVTPGTVLALGRGKIRIGAADREGTAPAAERFGGLVGSSPAMREMFARLEAAARSDATVLLEGESGTGKEGAAAALHAASTRADQPFVALDCGAIPATLFEAELFGAEPGAYTGAVARRIGAFEEASGGTLFLDEVGELAPEVQAKLLRAIETRKIRRLGARSEIACDVRIIAATNRDLREHVNAGAFRADLYYRFAVLRITLPPLRDRTGDLPELVGALLDRLGATADQRAALATDEHVAALARHAWPGNVRELRNHLERCLVFGISETAPTEATLSYEQARKHALDRFEKEYLDRLLRDAGGKVAEAAKVAGVDRAYLYRLIRRHRPE